MNNDVMETIGQLDFYQMDSLGSNYYGTLFCGTFKKTVEVAITKINKIDFHVDVNVLKKAQSHKNILRFHGIEENVYYQ